MERTICAGVKLIAKKGVERARQFPAIARFALYLDPRSDWASKTPAPVQAAARGWFGRNPNPFTDGSQDWSWYGSR